MSWCWDEPLEQRSLPGFQHPPPNSHQNTWGRVCMHHKDLVTQATKWFVLHVVWLHHKSKEFQAWSECPTLEDCGIFFKLSTLKDTPSVSLGCSHENWQKQLGIELKKKKKKKKQGKEIKGWKVRVEVWFSDVRKVSGERVSEAFSSVQKALLIEYTGILRRTSCLWIKLKSSQCLCCAAAVCTSL